MSIFEPALVLDTGSFRLRAGLSGDDAPRCIIPNVVGRNRPGLGVVMAGLGGHDLVVGDAAVARMGVLDFHFPVQDGAVQNWYNNTLAHTFIIQSIIGECTISHGDGH